jgi:hypothetical protein
VLPPSLPSLMFGATPLARIFLFKRDQVVSERVQCHFASTEGARQHHLRQNIFNSISYCTRLGGGAASAVQTKQTAAHHACRQVNGSPPAHVRMTGSCLLLPPSRTDVLALVACRLGGSHLNTSLKLLVLCDNYELASGGHDFF